MKLTRYINRVGMAGLAYRGFLLRLRSRGAISPDLGTGKGIMLSFGSALTCGERCYIGNDVNFEISRDASVTLGANVWISRGGHICCSDRIDIGDDVMIGEFTSIRDATHSHERLDVPIKRQQDLIGRISIEPGVWIGRGCLIQSRGNDTVVIGTGSIVAANSVVTKSIPPYEIWGGSPARFIRART